MKVFITRQQEPNSPFCRTLTPLGFEVVGMSLVSIKGIPFEPKLLPEFDWLFFYSANGIKYFHQSQPFVQAKIGVVGQASAKAVELYFGRKPNFVGEGTPEEVAAAFADMLNDESVLFARAERSEQSVQKKLQIKISTHDLVVYKNELFVPTEPINADVLVFTSPMNVEAYVNSNPDIPTKKIVAIGQTTAAALTSFGLNYHIIADKPDEESLARAVLKILGLGT